MSEERTSMQEQMKSLPVSERPYERCERFGPEALSDAELLAVILRTGTMGVSALQLAHQILNKDENDKNLIGLCHLSREQMMEIPGIGMVKAIQLQAITELAKRISKSVAEENIQLHKPALIAEFFMHELRFETQECVYAVFFDQKCKLIKKCLITKGTVNASLISAREIFLEALRCSAVQLVVVHNHPSGNPEPSTDDICITSQLKAAGKLLGMPLVDHIIVGGQTYYSFAEHHQL